jgi:hypothetical protein
MSVETARSKTFSASAREIKSSGNAGDRVAAVDSASTLSNYSSPEKS